MATNRLTEKNGKTAAPKQEAVTISAPNFKIVELTIRGTAPYMQCRFSQKAREGIIAIQTAGSTGRKGKKRDTRNFDQDFEGAKHVSLEGWYGIPAGSFRNAAIDACRLTGFKMTHAKLSVFIEHDGLEDDGTPLVKLDAPSEPENSIMPGRNSNGSFDLRARPQWKEWGATIRVRYDADQFTMNDIINLFLRVGQQVGIGEGRPNSRMSNGIGFGLFTIEEAKAKG